MTFQIVYDILKNIQKNGIKLGVTMSEPLKIAICEDLKEDSEILKLKIKEAVAEVSVRVFDSGEAFFQTYQKGMYHLIFLDIYMTGATGMNVAAAIREAGDLTPIAFATTSRDHALEANKYRALLYIEKPVTAHDVAHTLSIAEAVRQQRKKEILSVTDSKRRNIDVTFDDITFIEVLNHRCTVHLSSGGEIAVRTATTIDELDSLLPRPRFFRSHRSFVVNFDYVKETDNNFNFVMKNGDLAYIRVRDFKKMKEAYADYLFGLSREENQ